MVEEYVYFYLHLWPLFATWFVIIFVLLGWSGRKSPWSVVLWLPAVVLGAICTFYYFKLLMEHWEGYGGDLFSFGMAVHYMMEVAPTVVAFVALLIFHPARAALRTWACLAAILASGLAPLGIARWFQASRPVVEFRVTDTTGKPLSGIRLEGDWPLPANSGEEGWVRVQIPYWATIATTGDDGRVRATLPHRYKYHLAITGPGWQRHGVFFRTNRLGTKLDVRHSWSQK